MQTNSLVCPYVCYRYLEAGKIQYRTFQYYYRHNIYSFQLLDCLSTSSFLFFTWYMFRVKVDVVFGSSPRRAAVHRRAGNKIGSKL